MVVQHNLTAMNSNRMLGVTTKTQSKTTEKLSSGYKINRAADDAAGLAISEKMRKQIRGLTQASANAQDGISAVQTAEGALTEVQDMLQRMNELAVKASNGTQSESDRASIQAEIDQLATEIDRVAETTKFNETYLLKGDRNVEKGYSYSYRAVSKNKAAAATMDQDDATKLTAEIKFNSSTAANAKPAAAADQNAVAKALRDQGITITAKQVYNTDGTLANKATYSVTLNGSAANTYKINTKNNEGTNIGAKTTDGKKVDFSTGTAAFEIVDLQGNKIADIKIAGGIGSNIAAESSKVITANTVEAAENAGDVKQFYDADGNAISENALGSYFSKLSTGGGTRTLYTYDPNGGATASDKVKAITQKEGAGGLDEANAAKKVLYTTLGVTYTTGNTLQDIDISGVSGAKIGDVYTFDGDKWTGVDKDGANLGTITGIKYKEGTAPAKSNVLTVDKVDTKSVDNPGKVTFIDDATGIYTAKGEKLTAAELEEMLNKQSDAYTTLNAGNPLKVNNSDSTNSKKTSTTDARFTNTPKLSGEVAIKKGKWTYRAAGQEGKEWINEDNATTMSIVEMKAAISNYKEAFGGELGDGGYFTVDDNTGNFTAIDATNKNTYYTYTPGTATLEVDAVAPQAGKQLYDAVGNALDGSKAIDGNPRLTMALAAKEVAANKNLTGALGLNLHVGADATKNNQIDLKIEAMSAKGLGINGIRVDGRTDSNALNSIGTIKEALAKVSAQRSQLGAVQNRLEHTINNLDNVVENTTSAESAIRDTDMATTMVQFSNNNILTQAGTSMLAQANQSNQSVLSLLQ